jgi:2-haloacid dehalogenase
MRLTDFKVLSFGCDGTLIDRDSGVYTALRPLLERGHVKFSRQQVLAAFGRHEAAQQAPTPTLPYSRLLSEVHSRLAKEWAVSVSDDDNALFAQSVPQWPVFVDTPAGLQYLQRYFKLVVLSNVDRAAFAASARRLGTRFDEVVTAEEVGAYKPDLKGFADLAQRVAGLGFERRHVLHIGASLARDLVPARRCGLATALIERPSERAAGNATVEPGPAACEFRFATLVDMVAAHQDELRS